MLLGTPRHPEVVGLLGFAPDAIVVDEEEDWDKIPRRKKMALLSQSTQPPWKFEKLAAFMVGRCHELKIVNTVCPVTIRRQEDTIEAARDVDLMVVVGGRSSANTKELTRLCGIVGTPAIQIESEEDLTDAAVFGDAQVVGVTGGTSTPIEDLRCVAERVLPLAGTAEAAAHAEELATRRARRGGHAGRPDDFAAGLVPGWPGDRALIGRSRPVTAGGPKPPFARRAARPHNPCVIPLPIVAIVGRPNVGKSTLFNRIVGHRTAIVEDRARTTRDRIYGDAEWNGRRFIVVDTGGLEIKPGDPIEEKVQEQARLAIGEADVIVLVVDSIAGLTPADIEAADLLRTAKAPVLVAANKADNDKRELEAAEFYSLGWEETYPISAAHGRGVADLLDAIVWALPPESEQEIERKRREAEADEWARDMADGRLARIRDGDEEGDRARRGGRRRSCR